MPESTAYTNEPKKENVSTRGLDIASVEESWGFKGQNYLFTIGIDHYLHWPTLRCAVKDVQDFAAILQQRYQFDQEHWMTLLNIEATLKNILIKFKELFYRITPEDNLIIYFSGHGHYDKLTKTGFWIPVDAQKLADDTEHEFINTAIIFDKLRNLETLHTFLIIDACFSGSLLHRLRAEPRGGRYKSRLVFASGRAEVVSDGQEGSNSPFAKGLIHGLTLNTDKYLTASKLIIEAKEYVEKEAKQTPVDARLINADDQGGDFVFHLKMSEAEIWAIVVKQDTKEAYLKFMEHFPNSMEIPKAQEAHDWLVASDGYSVQSYSNYLNKYQPDGKHVQLAIGALDAIEEKEYWANAKEKNTLAAYYDYLKRYPKGNYVTEAKDMILQQSDRNTRTILPVFPTLPINPAEKDAWDNAEISGTYKDYLDFVQAFPGSQYVEGAKNKMEYLDNIELNNIKKLLKIETLTLQDKINRCIQYFNDFPGAYNNVRVKQIKDQLVLRMYSGENEN